MFKKCKRSLFIAIIGVALFVIAHTFYNYDIVRKYVEDSAFDYFSSHFLSTKAQKANAPNTFVFRIDQKFLANKQLLNEEGKINYGYIFPRDQLADFISQLDQKVASLSTPPKALFIDYDLTFSSMPYGSTMSLEDQKLLNVLKHPRPYTIILPQTMQKNFFASHLHQEIMQGSIIFTSVGFHIDSDGFSRRYQPIKSDSPHVALVLYELSGHTLNKEAFKQIEVVENKIIIKSIQNSNNYIDQSYWQELKFLSANDLPNLVSESLSGAIMMLGADHDENSDFFVSKNGELSGVALHGNTLMSLFWLGGKLKQVDLLTAIIIVFSVAFLVEMFVEHISYRYKIQSVGTEFLFLVSILSIVMLSISYIAFVYFKLWFNWFIPLLVLQLHKIWGLLQQIFKFTTIDYQERLSLFLRFGFK
jgi:CHASE2 domain-containing sensor protein